MPIMTKHHTIVRILLHCDNKKVSQTICAITLEVVHKFP